MDDSYIFDLPGSKLVFLFEIRITFTDLPNCGPVDSSDRDPWDNDLLSEGGQARTQQDCCNSGASEGLPASFRYRRQEA